jgi:uncharacterized protein YydD (DUF2326 family)
MQQPGDYQMVLMYLLGLDWNIARDWQVVRKREKTLKELKKAVADGALGQFIETAAELRTKLTVAESRLTKLTTEINNFRVLPEYHELEIEASELTRKLNEIANANAIDRGIVADVEEALTSEAAPSVEEVETLYREAGIVLPNSVVKRYTDVKEFHESVIRNRKDYLAGELEAAQSRIDTRALESVRLDGRRQEIMEILQSHGALEHYSKLRSELTRIETSVENLRSRFEAAEQLEGAKNELEIERNRLTLRLRRDFAEQRQRLSEAILAFEEVSSDLYESAGSMNIEETSNGPVFTFPMQGSRSKGIKNMQIFCFDMMLMRLCSERKIGPGFLIHDSHLFDGVDGRQMLSALRIGAKLAQDYGFQYIVTLNEDDAFKETEPNFNIEDYVLPIRLTDAT